MSEYYNLRITKEFFEEIKRVVEKNYRDDCGWSVKLNVRTYIHPKLGEIDELDVEKYSPLVDR